MRLLVVGTSFLGALAPILIAEATLRTSSPFCEPSWPIAEPGAVVRWTNHHDYWVISTYNSLGFLDREPQQEQLGDNLCRVAFVGDSFVEAAQVPIEDRVQTILEDRIPELDVIAIGRSGTGANQQADMVQATGLVFDAIVMVTVSNDIVDGHPDWYAARGGVDWKTKKIEEPRAEPSWLFRALDHGCLGRKLLADVGATWPSVGAAIRNIDWNELTRTRLRKRGIESEMWRRAGDISPDTLFAEFPADSVIEDAIAEHQKGLTRLCALTSGQCLQVLAYDVGRVTYSARFYGAGLETRQQSYDPKFHFSRDGHWSALGHRDVANRVESWVRTACEREQQ